MQTYPECAILEGIVISASNEYVLDFYSGTQVWEAQMLPAVCNQDHTVISVCYGTQVIYGYSFWREKHPQDRCL